MGLNRREFLAGMGAGACLRPLASAQARANRVPKPYFGLHSFIEKNPKAVFIRRTHVPHKMDADAKRREGLTLAREIFMPQDAAGVPVTHRVILKPNFTSVRERDQPLETNWGTGTDPQFYEGMVMGLKEIGVNRFHFIEANSFQLWNTRGFVDINERLGVEMNEPERRRRHFRDSYEMTWSKVPDGVVYTRIPHYAPVNEPDTWLLNIAKWKAHGMCLTQSVKNEQGLVVPPFVRFCMGWNNITKAPDLVKPDTNPRAEQMIQNFVERHRRMGYSRYQSPQGRLTPEFQEIWAHRTCDNQSVLKTGLAMIEGICARDGDGFGVGQDYLTNLVMFSKDKFRLDVIGLYLGGHEPGNVHLYRIAKERGLTDTFNPWEIPVYEWLDGRAVPRKLTDFPRTPLKTYYLQLAGEPEYHLVNERFDYDKWKT